MFKVRSRTLIATLIGASAVLLAGAPLTPAPAAVQQVDASEPDGIDRIILNNGRIIEGKILSETSSEIEILIIFKGIKAPTTFRKSEILSVERNVRPAESTPSTKSATKTAQARKTPSTRTQSNADSAEGDRAYLITLKGDLGWEISKTPLQKVFDDAIASNPDVIIIKMDAGSRPRSFDGLWKAEALSPIIEKAIDDGYRVVFWIKRAHFGASFLPLIGPEIYFMTDGTLGGIGDLSDFDTGDKTVNLKQISLRIGHAEGIAITGGYNPILIRAMALKEAWLAVRWQGGKPIYITWEPRPEDGDYRWDILTDDGDGDNEDEYSFEGNDVLVLEADMAQKLLLSKGTVDQMDDLAFELNLSRDYSVINEKPEQILSDWRKRIERTEDELKRLRKRLDETGRGGGRRRGGRSGASPEGKKINILKQIRSLLTAYEEVFDPTGQGRSNIDVEIEQLRETIRRSNRRR